MRTLFSILVCIGLLACGATPTETPASRLELPLAEEPLRVGKSVLRVARIRMQGSDSIIVELPARVRRGEPADVYVTTYGGGCVGRDTTIANVLGQRALIVPYQREYQPPSNGGCTAELRLERRPVRLVFATSGDAVVRVIGRVWPDTGLVAVERRLTVQ